MSLIFHNTTMSVIFRWYISCLLFLTNIISFVSGFKALGTDPPPKCDITKSDCPSHYICEGGYGEEAEYGECRCDRFYGFYGPTCERLSITSYVYAIIFCLFLSIYSLITISHIVCLLRLLYVRRKLSFVILTTLLINMTTPLITIYFVLEYVLTIFGIDERMFMRANLRIPMGIIFLFPSVLSSVEVSGNWIRLTKKLRKSNVYFNRYTLVIFIVFIIFASLTVQTIFNYHAIESVFVLTPFLIGLSYWYGGQVVVKALRSMYVPGKELSGAVKHALELADAIERTNVSIITLCFLNVVGSLVAMFTYHTKHPYYKGQNHLPRWAQGQIGCFMILVCAVGISHQVTQYFHFTCLRHDMKHVPLTFISTKDSKQFRFWNHLPCSSVFTVLWNINVPRDDIDDDFNMLSSRVDEECSFDGSSTTSYGAELVPVLSFRNKSNSQEVHSMLSSTLEVPIALVTFNRINNHIISRQVVIDNESGNLVDFMPSDEESADEEKGEQYRVNSTNNILSVGSHAFIRCADESHLRCSMDSFEFGHAIYQHEWLGGRNAQVLMAGELEVDDKGILTRWLNNSDLYSVPRHVTGSAGLPFHLSWLHISQSEYETMDVEKRQILEESQCLIEIPSSEMSSVSSSDNVSPVSHIVHFKERVCTRSNSSNSSNSRSSWPSLGRSTSMTEVKSGYAIKADEDPKFQPKVSSISYTEAQKRISHFKEMAKSLLDINSHKISAMDDVDIINLAVNQIEDGLDPACDSYYKDKKMIFDMREDEEEEKKRNMKIINDMKIQMTEAGVFDNHRLGRDERRKWKAELGYSPHLELSDCGPIVDDTSSNGCVFLDMFEDQFGIDSTSDIVIFI